MCVFTKYQVWNTSISKFHELCFKIPLFSWNWEHSRPQVFQKSRHRNWPDHGVECLIQIPALFKVFHTVWDPCWRSLTWPWCECLIQIPALFQVFHTVWDPCWCSLTWPWCECLIQIPALFQVFHTVWDPCWRWLTWPWCDVHQSSMASNTASGWLITRLGPWKTYVYSTLENTSKWIKHKKFEPRLVSTVYEH